MFDGCTDVLLGFDLAVVDGLCLCLFCYSVSICLFLCYWLDYVVAFGVFCCCVICLVFGWVLFVSVVILWVCLCWLFVYGVVIVIVWF